jgi:hypothetical protein
VGWHYLAGKKSSVCHQVPQVKHSVASNFLGIFLSAALSFYKKTISLNIPWRDSISRPKLQSPRRQAKAIPSRYLSLLIYKQTTFVSTYIHTAPTKACQGDFKNCFFFLQGGVFGMDLHHNLTA